MSSLAFRSPNRRKASNDGRRHSYFSDLVEFAFAERSPEYREAMYRKLCRGGVQEIRRIQAKAERRFLAAFGEWGETRHAEVLQQLEDDPGAPFGYSTFSAPVCSSVFYYVAIRQESGEPLCFILEDDAGAPFDLEQRVAQLKAQSAH